MGCSHFYEWEDCPVCNPNGNGLAEKSDPTMKVKVTEIHSWHVSLDGDVPPFRVNSVDGHEGSVKVTLGTSERIVAVTDWLAFAKAVEDKIGVRLGKVRR